MHQLKTGFLVKRFILVRVSYRMSHYLLKSINPDTIEKIDYWMSLVIYSAFALNNEKFTAMWKNCTPINSIFIRQNEINMWFLFHVKLRNRRSRKSFNFCKAYNKENSINFPRYMSFNSQDLMQSWCRVERIWRKVNINQIYISFRPYNDLQWNT